MWPRVLFLLITTFFLIMNVLLWRAEFGARSQSGSTVPPEVVFRKMLLAPDDSRLEIRHHRAFAGSLTLSPSIGEEHAPGKIITDEPQPEGMIKRVSGYNLLCDGFIALDANTRVKVEFQIRLNTNYVWQDWRLRLNLRPAPYVWEVRSVAAEQTVRFLSEDDGGITERVFKFSELHNPEKILRELGGPFLPGTLMALGIPLHVGASANASLGLTWQARNDRLQIGHAQIKGYRLKARLLDRFEASIFVNTLGEVMRVDLPDEIVLMNMGLTSL
jgi:hypothetical protein